jgi:hypothetical protein
LKALAALGRAFDAWEHFLFARVDAAPLAALRIALGAYLVVYYVQASWFLGLYLGPPGLLPPDTLPATVGGFVLGLVPYTAGARMTLLVLALASAVGLALGLNTRASALIGWLMNRAFAVCVIGRNSGDGVVSVLCFLVLVAALLGHAQRVWALDARHAPRSDATVPAVVLRLLQLQLVAVYFFSGFHKLASPDWYRGEALYYAFQQTQWLRVSPGLIEHPLLVGAASYGVLLFELFAFPVLVWGRATRGAVLAVGVLLHVGIALTMRVFVFGEIMPIFYLCFVDPRPAVARGLTALAALRSRISASGRAG